MAFLSLHSLHQCRLGKTQLHPRNSARTICVRRRDAKINVSRRVIVASIDPNVTCVLSHFEAESLLKLKKVAARLSSAEESEIVHGAWLVDLGRRSLQQLVVTQDGIVFDASQVVKTDENACPHVTFKELQKMCKKGRTGAYECFVARGIAPQKVAGISALTGRTASLFPYDMRSPPTVILAGFGMHRFKNTDAAEDTRMKLMAFSGNALRGNAIDICTGLGYAAIELASIGLITQVTTIELDPLMVEMQEKNPWSADLFQNEKIERIVGDASQVLSSLPACSFDVAIHDPPAQAISGDLYSELFYRKIARILRPGASLFHYIGDPHSEASGRLYPGVLQRLSKAGFQDLRRAPAAFGVTGIKT